MAPKKEANKEKPPAKVTAADQEKSQEKGDKVSAQEKGDKGEKKEEKKEDKDKMPPKPDEKKFNDEKKAIEDAVAAKRQEVDKLKKQIEKKNEGKPVIETQRGELRKQMEEAQTRRQALIGEKKEIKNKMFEMKKEKNEMERNIKSMEKDVKTMDEGALDEKIRSLEYQMHTKVMPLKEEKSLMQEIKKLNALKPKAAKLVRELEGMKAKGAVSESLPFNPDQRLPQIDGELDKLSEEKEALKTKLDSLQDERKKKLDGMSTLIDQRKAIFEEVDKLNEKKGEIISAYRTALRVFNEYEKKKRQEVAKKREAARVEAQREWELEQAKRELDKPNPFGEQTQLLEQTIDYCKGLLPRENVAEEEKEEIVHPEGFKVLSKKADREAEMFLAAKKKAPKAKKAPKEGKGKAIKHSAETFQIFDQLKLSAPINTGDVPELIEKLNGKLDTVNAKVNKWEEERKLKIEEAMKQDKEAETTAESAPGEKASDKAASETKKSTSSDKEEK